MNIANITVEHLEESYNDKRYRGLIKVEVEYKNGNEETRTLYLDIDAYKALKQKMGEFKTTGIKLARKKVRPKTNNNL